MFVEKEAAHIKRLPEKVSEGTKWYELVLASAYMVAVIEFTERSL